MTFTLDGFEIGTRIGAGGFGEVWKARQVGVDRPVAIKVGNTAIHGAQDQLRFERECKALGKLSTHANIVTVYTSGQLPDGRPILVLEFVDGGTLQSWALNNSSTEAQILNLGADLASALVEAHGHNILHRDLKPQNVLLRTTGEAILADFGIAQMQDGLRTVTGNVTASAAYAAPEVLNGDRASNQSDIYGIGICMLAAATQATPFTDTEDSNLYPVLTRVLTADPPDVTDFGYSDRLNGLLQKLLSKEPAGRHASATEVLNDLRRLNVGPDSYQRVTPLARGAAGNGIDEDLPTEGPDGSAAVSASMVQHQALPAQPAAQPAQPAQPAAQPAQPAQPAAQPAQPAQPAAQPAQPAPPAAQPAQPAPPAAQPVQPAPSSASPAEPATVPVAHLPTSPVQGYAEPPNVPVGADTVHATAGPPVGAASAPDGVGPSPAKIGVLLGGVVLAAVALFFLFGRGGDDSSTNPTQVDSTNAGGETQSAGSTQGSNADGSASAASAEPPAPTVPPVVVDSPAVASVPVSDLAEVSGSIDVALDFRDFPVSLVAGQGIGVQVTSVNGTCADDDRFDLELVLLDPSGEQLGDTKRVGTRGCQGYGSTWQAQVDGTHMVRFVGGSGSGSRPATGSFEAIIGALTQGEQVLDLSAPAIVSGVIDRTHDFVDFTFDLDSGQEVAAEITAINGTCMNDDVFDLNLMLVGPNGQQVGDSKRVEIWGCQGYGSTWQAETDGMHRVRFFSAGGSDRTPSTGSFEAIIGQLLRIEQTIEADAVTQVSGVIDRTHDSVDYILDLSPGDEVALEITAMNGSCESDDEFDLNMMLLAPNGERVGDAKNAEIWGCQGYGSSWEAEVDGPHRVRFESAGGGNGTPAVGSFDAVIGRLLRRQEDVDLEDPLQVSATIDRALDSVDYLVDMKSGESISMGLESLNGSCDNDDEFDLLVSLLAPNGEQVGDSANPGIWGCDSSGRWFVEADGQYRLRFHSNVPGSYEAILGMPRSPVEDLGDQRISNVSHTVDIPRDQIGYEMELAQGQQVSVTITAVNGSCESEDDLDVKIRVLDGAGNAIGDDGNVNIWGCRAYGPWQVPADGSYTVLFIEGGGRTGSFSATIGRLGG